MPSNAAKQQLLHAPKMQRGDSESCEVQPATDSVSASELHVAGREPRNIDKYPSHSISEQNGKDEPRVKPRRSKKGSSRKTISENSKLSSAPSRVSDDQQNVLMVLDKLTGYTGNLFHDFTDPLFTTASQFNGEVQFLITDMALWWTIKYHTLLQKLSKYPLIDFSKDDQVHCFKHAIVGTHAYMEFTIDASKSPHGVTMVDFNRFMRAAYSLSKETAVALGESPKVKPRLLITKRHRIRMFLNLEEIIAMAEEL
ncbi:Auxin response factor 11 [Hordeum vulgare]|nr:Auxin response factor 11 [Hordeum vulgare]